MYAPIYINIYRVHEYMFVSVKHVYIYDHLCDNVYIDIYIYVKIYGFIYLVPDLQNTASCITICLLDKGNPMGLASITVFFYKPLALNWLCNSWHFLRQAQHLPMQAQCQHPSQFFNSQNHPKSTIDFIVTLGEKLGKHRGKSRLFRHHSFFFTSPWSKEHPAKLVQRDGQRDLCAQKSRCIGLEKQAENNDLLSSLLNEETRTDINDDRNDDNGFNDDNGDNNGCEERRVRMKSGRIKTFISGSTKHHKRDQQILIQDQKKSTSSRNCSGDVYSALGGTLE